MNVSVDLIKELRRITYASIADCKKALHESEGDLQKAVEFLRKRGLEIAAKRQDSAAKEGRVEAYVHMGNKIGVLLEVSCETDFVARNSDFVQFAKDVAMHIVACDPSYIKEDEVPQDVIDTAGDRNSYLKENCLMDQSFVKDPSITIRDYMASLISKFGENIIIRRFTRYKIGL